MTKSPLHMMRRTGFFEKMLYNQKFQETIGLIFIWNEPDIWGMFFDTPWHWMFIGTGLLFGIIMGAITVFAKMKRQTNNVYIKELYQ